MLTDSHCHLDFPDFDGDRDQILEQCASAGIRHICLPATEQQHWPRLTGLLGSHDSGVTLWGALGLHPYFLDSHQDHHLQQLDEQLCQNNKHIIAVGECGLDLYIPEPDLARQQALFIHQIEIAARHGLPLILHIRKAHDLAASLLRTMKFQEGGIVHAWSGSQQQAQNFLKLGFRLGIGGSLTYDRAKKLRKQVAYLPESAFVLETDAPDMPPADLQGQRNTPLTLLRVLDTMAEIRQQPKQELAAVLQNNVQQALRLPG